MPFNVPPARGSALSALSRRLGLFAAATVATLAMATQAQAVVVTSTTTISIPQNIDGVYVNLVTGATSTASFSGFDIDPYATSTGVAFYFGGAGSPNNGGVSDAALTAYLDLTPGSVVGPSSVYSQNAQTAYASAFQSAGRHTLGVRFLNEGTGAVNYGYVYITVSGSNGFPSSITGWAYENTGAAITVPGAVPEPASALMMLGGGLALLAAARRRKSA